MSHPKQRAKITTPPRPAPGTENLSQNERWVLALIAEHGDLIALELQCKGRKVKPVPWFMTLADIELASTCLFARTFIERAKTQPYTIVRYVLAPPGKEWLEKNGMLPRMKRVEETA